MGKVTYPLTKEVETASHTQICTWHRFLPSPETPAQVFILDAIFKKFVDGGMMTPSISKEIGWKN
jgi:hypothetical protein